MQYSKELLTEIHIKLDREGLDGLNDKEISVLLSEQIYNTVLPIHGKLDEISGTLGKLDEDVSFIREELNRFQKRATVIGTGIWAVVASLIASLIFRACGG